jgi:4-carboxymuconolactone decarboxylase
MTPTSTPRLAPLPVEQWDEDARAMLRGRVKRADPYLSTESDAPHMPNVLGILAHHPELAGAWLTYNGVLLERPTLDPRHRELLILRVAWRSRSTYEWAQHVRLATGLGISEEQIDAVTRGAAAEIWSPLERLLLAAADQLLDRHRVDDATWVDLARHLDTRQLMEVLFVTGSYLCLAMVFNSVGLRLDPGMDQRLTLAGPETEERP